MTFTLVHLSDPHFGDGADLGQIDAIGELVPDLEPDLIVISGDLTQRARHGEFQAARGFIRELERTAPVYKLPGNHDVQWWRRPFIPFGARAKYAKYRTYFGDTLTPTLRLPGAVVTGALTAHGVAWGSLTPRLRDIAVKGHLPKAESTRVAADLATAEPGQARVLVLHHNVLRGRLSQRMGLARWRTAQRRIAASGAELVLCGHDHEERIAELDGRVVVACANTSCMRARGGHPGSFYRVAFTGDAIQVEVYRWNDDRRAFRRADVFAFARSPRGDGAGITAAVG